MRNFLFQNKSVLCTLLKRVCQNLRSPWSILPPSLGPTQQKHLSRYFLHAIIHLDICRLGLLHINLCLRPWKCIFWGSETIFFLYRPNRQAKARKLVDITLHFGYGEAKRKHRPIRCPHALELNKEFACKLSREAHLRSNIYLVRASAILTECF